MPSDYGEEVEWCHWGCVTPGILMELAVAGLEDVHGFSQLKPSDQQKIRKAVAMRRVDPSDIPQSARPTPANVANASTSRPEKRKLPPVKSQARSPMSQPSTSQVRPAATPPSTRPAAIEDDAGTDNAEEAIDELICEYTSKVVGIQYYHGLVGPGEEVVLQREPTNRYDGNAIRVLNIAGTQVGHIPRNVASNLAPLLDARKITLEGVMLDGNLGGRSGVWNLTVKIKIYGPSDKIDELEERLRWAMPAGSSRQRTTAAPSSSQYQPPPPSYITPSQRAPSQSPEQMERIRKQQEALRKAAELREMLNTLEKVNDEGRRASLLDSLCSVDDVLALPVHEDAPGPSKGDLTVELLKHQKQGLQWCLERENPVLPSTVDDKPVQFWQLKENPVLGKRYYFNIATKTPQEAAPPLGRGALFADAMGLGKTLTMLALILATKRDVPSDFSNATLVVVPLSVLSNWEKQIKDHCAANTLTYCTYYGASRDKLSAGDLERCDVVFTTYQTVTTEHDTSSGRATKKKKLDRALFDVKWKRVVLDEGHQIRNPKTKMAQAVCTLESQRRWVLTGTPIINSPRDLGSLLTFLRICQPLDSDDMFKRLLIRPLKDGRPEGAELLRALMNQVCIRRTKEMQDSAGNPLVPLPSVDMIKVPVALSEEARQLYDEIEQLSADRFQSILSSGSGNAILQSNALGMLTRMRQLALHPGLLPANYLEELRSAKVNEGQPAKILTPEEKYRLQIRLGQSIEDSEECPICFSIPEEPKITSCAHFFCFPCIKEILSRDPKCPMDRGKLTLEDLFDPLPPTDATQPVLREPEPESRTQSSSAKIDQLVHLLQLTPAGEKSLVFSQFTSFLDKIGDTLAEKGIPFVRLDGKMSAKRREEAITRFSVPLATSKTSMHKDTTPQTPKGRAHRASRKKSVALEALDGNDDDSDDDFAMGTSEADYSDFEDERPKKNSKGKGKGKQTFTEEDDLDDLAFATDENPTVMLLSLKAGAVGLNLTVANNVYLMDPWWQEGIESQAIDRVNRIGQTKPVHVYQLISENTVEARVLDIQERKKNLIKQAFSGMKSKETPRQQREARLQDLVELFGIRQQQASQSQT
ncbi:hypothetical protein PQX77_012488 [Marasmius sp. AFHP31]|nr:hypothetical protein PQX77_012488 [Marasmius sp. AFHP31]